MSKQTNVPSVEFTAAIASSHYRNRITARALECIQQRAIGGAL